MEELYGWVFNYNPFTSKWRAVKREFYPMLFSEDENKAPVLSSGSIETLVELIVRTEGIKENIDKLVK